MTGLRPIAEAPIPIPVNPAYVMGVSIILLGPYLSISPFEILYAPWYCPTSSPIKNTFGFAYNYSSNALFKAYLFVIFAKDLLGNFKRFFSITLFITNYNNSWIIIYNIINLNIFATYIAYNFIKSSIFILQRLY